MTRIIPQGANDASSVLIKHVSDNFPRELRDLAQWVVWRFETRQGQDKPTKVLYNLATGQRADSTNPATWGTFDNASATFTRGGYAGVGFVVTADDPYVGVDLDGCIVDGQLTDNARRWVDLLSSYTEITPSGKGLRIWVRAVKPGERCKNPKLGVEIYETDRFFTVTGNHLEGTPAAVQSRQKAFTAFYNELFPQEQPAPASRPTLQPVSDAIPQDDQELLHKMFNARNGAAVRALWMGDKLGYIGPDGQPDESAADLALCNHLAFWTGCDAQRMDRLFRQSGLMRPKWDRRARQGETYGQGTIARAIANTSETYDPNRRRDNTSGGNGDTSGNGGRQVDPLTTINIARQWIKTHSFQPFIDPEFLAVDGTYRTEMTDRRVADALLDVLQERGVLAGFISLRDLRRRAGVGVATVKRAMARLMGWFVALSDHEQNKDAGGALHYILTFRVDGTQDHTQADLLGGRSICAKSPFTTHKAADAFNVGGNRDMRNAALREVLGRAPVDVLIQLEAFDQPRRDAHTDYRTACKEVAALGEQMTPADVVTLTRLADGLIDAPQPVTLAALSHIDDYGAGVKVLAELGALALEHDTVYLFPDYAAVINPHVASLGPVALLMIDASTEHGDLSYDEFTQHTGLKYGTLHRAMTKLQKREIYQADRDGMIKRFTLCCDWLSEVQAQAVTMRTYGLQQKRELADAKAVFDYCSQLIATAAPAEQPKLERRRERAFNRLMAAVALEAPSMAGNVNFAVAMRTAGQMNKPQAPAMPEPGALAWYRLTELTGKELLTAYEYEELQQLDKTLGAGVGGQHGMVEFERPARWQ